MPSEPQRADEPPFSASETDAEEVLSAHGGDANAAVRGCLNHIAALEMQVSRGFIRQPLAAMSTIRSEKG